MERMSEWDDLTQCVHLTDRQDYLSGMLCNWALCLGIERSAGLVVPERAEYIRVIMGELNRLSSHCLWFGAFCMDLGAFSAFFYGFREREMIVDLFEAVCGARLTYNYIRPGGVARDITPDFEDKARDICETLKKAIEEYETLVTGNIIFRKRTEGIGVLSAEKALSYGVSGPTLRASGPAIDLRKTDPYSIYDRFDFDIPTATQGDCLARYNVRIEEMRQSIRIIEQALEKIPGGPVLGDVPRLLKLPKGESTYSRLETARGDMGVYLVGNGTTRAYRCKYRSACFSNLSALADISVGHKIADVVAILGSIDVVIPDIDR
jgi:NADH-quinone oxidoreductase subunit D/NADH-quinone oxidoreductase subunit C/D